MVIKGIYERKIYSNTYLDDSVKPERTDFIIIQEHEGKATARLVIRSSDVGEPFYPCERAAEFGIWVTDCFVDKSIDASLEDIEIEDLVPCPDRKKQIIAWVADLDKLVGV